MSPVIERAEIYVCLSERDGTAASASMSGLSTETEEKEEMAICRALIDLNQSEGKRLIERTGLERGGTISQARPGYRAEKADTTEVILAGRRHLAGLPGRTQRQRRKVPLLRERKA